ncbi:MAG: ABC transporter ATP-binding protein [Spirochaetes bacterium]|nr:ABC transporter ATP-binding protein [Spirochaetota bacterium]
MANNQGSSTDGLLVLRGIHKKFGKVEALRDLNLVARKGEILAILGPSGAGKTTTLKIIAGLEVPLSGEVVFNRRVINRLEPKDRNMSMVFETYALYPHISVYDNLASSLSALKLQKSLIKEKVERIAGLLGIAAFLDRKPANLSGGQRQRVALGRAMIKPADLYLMDEPIAHLDAKLRHRMIGEFKHLQESLELSTVYVTHDWQEAISLGNHIVILNKGRVEQYGSKEEIYEKPKNTFIAKLIGDPPMNLIPGTVVKKAGRSFFSVDGIDLGIPGNVAEGSAVLGVRPYNLKLVSGPSKEAVKTEIYSFERYGMNTVISIKIGEGTYKVKLDGMHRFTIGETVQVRFNLENSYIFDDKGDLITILGKANG